MSKKDKFKYLKKGEKKKIDGVNDDEEFEENKEEL
jgi:myosin heavy subunit